MQHGRLESNKTQVTNDADEDKTAIAIFLNTEDDQLVAATA